MVIETTVDESGSEVLTRPGSSVGSPETTQVATKETTLTIHDQVNQLAGREVEVEQLSDGRYVPLWMSFDCPPPKPEDTADKALEGLLTILLSKTKLDASVLGTTNSEG
jgi:hypothetical protein